MSATIEDLEKAEAELYEWATGKNSHWNEVHGSVTGEYALMWERQERADASAVEKLYWRVMALRLLLSN